MWNMYYTFPWRDVFSQMKLDSMAVQIFNACENHGKPTGTSRGWEEEKYTCPHC